MSPRIQIPLTKVGPVPVAYPVEVVSDPVNDHYLAGNDGNVWLEVRNTDVGQRQFVVPTPATIDGLPVKDISFPIEAGDTVVVGPFNPRLYNQRVAGAEVVHIDTSGTFLRFRAFHLDAGVEEDPGGTVSGDNPETEIPITEILAEEHFAPRVQPAYTDGEPVGDMALPWNDGRVILELNNLAGVEHTAVMNALGLFPIGQAHGGDGMTPPGGAMEISDTQMVVPANGHMIAGAFDPRIFNTRTMAPHSGGLRERVARVRVNVTTDQLQFRAYHLPRVKY